MCVPENLGAVLLGVMALGGFSHGKLVPGEVPDREQFTIPKWNSIIQICTTLSEIGHLLEPDLLERNSLVSL